MDNLELVKRLRALCARGATVRQAAAELGVPKTTLHRLASRHDVPRRRRGLSPEQERQILALARRGEQGVRRIARETGVSRSAVARRLIARLRQFVGAEYAPCRPWRCPCGLLLEIRKCVRCGGEKPRTTRVPQRP